MLEEILFPLSLSGVIPNCIQNIFLYPQSNVSISLHQSSFFSWQRPLQNKISAENWPWGAQSKLIHLQPNPYIYGSGNTGGGGKWIFIKDRGLDSLLWDSVVLLTMAGKYKWRLLVCSPATVIWIIAQKQC